MQWKYQSNNDVIFAYMHAAMLTVICILSGKGVDKDEHKAMEWFKYVSSLTLIVSYY